MNNPREEEFDPDDLDKPMPEGARKKAWLDDFGWVVPDWKPDADAPNLDVPIIQAMIDGKLSKEESGRVMLLTQTFRTWRDALKQILIEGVASERANNEEKETKPESDV